MRLFSGRCTSTARLDGKTAIVTGSNTGIGKFTVNDFYRRGARVIMACRNLDKANTAADDIRYQCQQQENLGEIIVIQLDLTSLTSVRNFAKNIIESEPHIHLLINNAGVMACPKGKTEDGFETQFGTNHLGHFLLTMLLLPTVVKSAPSRIVNVSSIVHKMGVIDFDDLNWDTRPYNPTKAYGQSKLANILFTKELALRIQDANIEGLTVYSLHPGVIGETDLARHLDGVFFSGFRWIYQNIFSWFMKTTELGAQTTIHCAVDEKAGSETGLYYADCEAVEPHRKANNLKVAKKLWDASVHLVGLEEDYDPFSTTSLRIEM